ncbi:flagellar motor switch protein FliM [Bacillus timonensis]|uniref:flagellar motor switch protein FliM n=1 Tax=Bacillus timonensis TaxID=1033734 RepID=UPI00028958C2|nr:flagellar motor switch protein FliM [Bacillus timonensis]
MPGEILSQSEIDALLSALSTGEMNPEELKREESERRVKVYDFKRALRFSKDQIRSITRIHENFARLLTTFFSAQLRTYVQITVGTADQVPYEEFIRSIPNMTILNVFEMPPLEGPIILEVNPNIAYAILDRMLGGKGTSYNKIENLTEIETKIMSNMFEKAFDQAREAWANLVEVDPILTDFEVNPQFLQMISPNETVVVISLNTQIGETSGMINICIPHVFLEPIIPKLSAHYWMQSAPKKERNVEELSNIKHNLKDTKLPIVAELGSADIAVQEFLLLDIGDTIKLEKMIDQPIELMVEGIPKFYAQVGRVNKKQAVQILEEIKGGNSEDE